MPQYTDQDYLNGIEQLLPELPDLLQPEAAIELEGRLRELMGQAQDPARRPQAVTLALDAISQHPAVRERLKSLLVETAGVSDESRLGIEPLPGGPQPIPLGTPVVCPKDPSHWQDDLRVEGERCPVCNRVLVPLD